MGEGPIPYVVDLTRFSEVRIECGMESIETTPEHFVKCMKWLIDTVKQDKDARMPELGIEVQA